MKLASENFNLAARIWKAVFDDLYDRAQFDWWWDGIDEDIQSEIRCAIRKIIEKELVSSRRTK